MQIGLSPSRGSSHNAEGASSMDPMERPLSPLERWYWIWDQVSPLNVIARARVSGPLSLSLLRRALDVLQARHPLLQVAVVANLKGDNPRFVRRANCPIPLRAVTRPASEDGSEAWQREVDEIELARSVDAREGPLARAAVISFSALDSAEEPRDHELLLTVSHTIADGTTALSLLEQWLTHAADLHAGRDARREPAVNRPAPEGLLPRPFTGVRGLKAVAIMQVRALAEALVVRPRRLRASEPIAFEARRSRLVHCELPADVVDALARRCREEGVSVHGALVAALVHAVAKEAKLEKRCAITVGSPVDIRGDLQPSVGDDEVGAYVTTLPTHVPYERGASIFAAARYVNGDLAARKARGEALASLRLVQFFAPRSLSKSRKVAELVESMGPGNICLSNLGRFPFPESIGPFRITGPQFIAGISVSGYFVGAVNTTHGVLHANFTYIDGIIPRQRADALATTWLDTVHRAL